MEEETENCYPAFADRPPAATVFPKIQQQTWSLGAAQRRDTFDELGSHPTDTKHPDS